MVPLLGYMKVYERVLILLVEVFEGSGNVKSSFVIYSYLKDKAFSTVKVKQSSK